MSPRFISITIPLVVVGLVFQGLFSGVSGFFLAVSELLLLSTIMASVFFLVSWGSRRWPLSFFRSFLLLGSITGVVVILGVIFTVVSNTFPGKLSKVTLSNGSGEIIFYQMSHIGTKGYYTAIQKELQDYARSGYVFYLEGVRPGTPENQDILDRSLGIRLGSGTYAHIAEFLGMEAQDRGLYHGLPEARIREVDISVDDIVRLMGTGAIRSIDPLDIEQELSLTGITDIGRSMFQAFFRAVMNLTLRSGVEGDLIPGLDPKIMSTLLDSRNAFIVDTYLKESPDKAIFLYGGLHFDGIYAGIKKTDPRWQIDHLSPLYPYVR